MDKRALCSRWGFAGRNATLEAPACQVRFSEGRACRVRGITFDYPLWFDGHDKHAPPILLSEGPACRVRFVTFDHLCRFAGTTSAPLRGFSPFPALPARGEGDCTFPPRAGGCKGGCVSATFGGTRLSGPPHHV